MYKNDKYNTKISIACDNGIYRKDSAFQDIEKNTGL